MLCFASSDLIRSVFHIYSVACCSYFRLTGICSPDTMLTDPEESRKTTSVLTLNFMAGFLKTVKATRAKAAYLGSRQTEPCSSLFSLANLTQRNITSSMISLLNRGSNLCCIHQIIITSCKAVCSETLCWWPPVFEQRLGLSSADDFSKPPS